MARGEGAGRVPASPLRKRKHVTLPTLAIAASTTPCTLTITAQHMTHMDTAINALPTDLSHIRLFTAENRLYHINRFNAAQLEFLTLHAKQAALVTHNVSRTKEPQFESYYDYSRMPMKDITHFLSLSKCTDLPTLEQIVTQLQEDAPRTPSPVPASPLKRPRVTPSAALQTRCEQTGVVQPPICPVLTVSAHAVLTALPTLTLHSAVYHTLHESFTKHRPSKRRKRSKKKRNSSKKKKCKTVCDTENTQSDSEDVASVTSVAPPSPIKPTTPTPTVRYTIRILTAITPLPVSAVRVRCKDVATPPCSMQSRTSSYASIVTHAPATAHRHCPSCTCPHRPTFTVSAPLFTIRILSDIVAWQRS